MANLRQQGVLCHPVTAITFGNMSLKARQKSMKLKLKKHRWQLHMYVHMHTHMHTHARTHAHTLDKIYTFAHKI